MCFTLVHRATNKFKIKYCPPKDIDKSQKKHHIRSFKYFLYYDTFRGTTITFFKITFLLFFAHFRISNITQCELWFKRVLGVYSIIIINKQ